MKDKTYISPLLACLIIAGVGAISGCSSHNQPSETASEQTSSSPAEMQAAHEACSERPTAAQAKDAANDPCAHVAFDEYVVRNQYRAGLGAITDATQALSMAHLQSGEWPASNAAAGLPAPKDVPERAGQGEFVESVTVGPKPGVITVKWGAGVLAGKQLVLTSATRQSNRSVACWSIDQSATTVPKAYQLAPIASACN